MARKDAATTKGTAKAPVKAKSAKAPAKAPAKALAKGPVKATSEKAKSTVTFGSAMPCLNCADVEAEVKFLVEGLGFQKHVRFDGPDGTLKFYARRVLAWHGHGDAGPRARKGEAPCWLENGPRRGFNLRHRGL